MLVVCAISAILIALVTPVIAMFKANTVSQAIYVVSGTIEQARTYAMSMNNYVYVGIDQDAGASPSGSMVIGVIASSDGTQIFSGSATSFGPNSTTFKPISKLLKIENIQIVSLPASSQTNGSPRQNVANNYKVGDPAFTVTSASSSAYSFWIGNYPFTSAPGATSTPGVTSEGILQIDPQGVVSQVGGDAVPFFELGMKPVHGNQFNFGAIQIAGLSGAVRVYRP